MQHRYHILQRKSIVATQITIAKILPLPITVTQCFSNVFISPTPKHLFIFAGPRHEYYKQ